MERIQKDVAALQEQVLDLQMMTGIETKIVVEPIDNDYYFNIQININGDYITALDEASYDESCCYLAALMTGYDIALASAFKKIHAN